MTPPKEVVAVIMALIKQHGLDGKLDKQELLAFTGVCLQEFENEREVAAKSLGDWPSRESVLEFYEREQAKEIEDVTDQVDTSRSTVDIGDLKGVPFSASMWEVVKESRFVGHLGKLDDVANWYALKWGNPKEGTKAIDAYRILQRCDREAIGCKNQPSSYPDWVVVTQAFGKKQPVRFSSEVIMCENAKCPSEGRYFNEAEAFYLFAKQSLWRRLLGLPSIYVCPYCGGRKVKPLVPGRVDDDRGERHY